MEKNYLVEFDGDIGGGDLAGFLRDVVCHEPKQWCQDCIVESCLYRAVFVEKKDFGVQFSHTDDTSKYQLVLSGRALEFFPYFIFALEGLRG